MAVLFDDTFVGPAALSAHDADTGQAWVLYDTRDGSVSNGLTALGPPNEFVAMTAYAVPDLTSTTGKFYITCNFDLTWPVGVYLGPFELRLKYGYGFYGVGFTFFDSGPLVDYGDTGYIPFEGLVQGENNVVYVLNVGTNTGEVWVNGTLTRAGSIVPDTIPGSGNIFVGVSSALSCRINRLSVSEEPFAPPEPPPEFFWTNLKRAAETP